MDFYMADHVNDATLGWELRALTITWSWPLVCVWSDPRSFKSIQFVCLRGHGALVVPLPRASSHGVPSPTHVNKFQHKGKVPTYEIQETIKVCFISILGYFLQNNSQALCWELSIAFCLTQLSAQLQAEPPKSIAM